MVIYVARWWDRVVLVTQKKIIMLSCLNFFGFQFFHCFCCVKHICCGARFSSFEVMASWNKSNHLYHILWHKILKISDLAISCESGIYMNTTIWFIVSDNGGDCEVNFFVKYLQLPNLDTLWYLLSDILWFLLLAELGLDSWFTSLLIAKVLIVTELMCSVVDGIGW